MTKCYSFGSLQREKKKNDSTLKTKTWRLKVSNFIYLLIITDEDLKFHFRYYLFIINKFIHYLSIILMERLRLDWHCDQNKQELFTLQDFIHKF